MRASANGAPLVDRAGIGTTACDDPVLSVTRRSFAPSNGTEAAAARLKVSRLTAAAEAEGSSMAVYVFNARLRAH